MIHQDGYIKFNCIWNQVPIDISSEKFSQLNYWRDKLYNLGLIGAYPDGIGYGNISIRTGAGFLISGSATGSKLRLSEEDYSLVTGYNFQKNEIYCAGYVKASSESLTHAAIYEISPEAKAVVHIHNLKIWKKYKNILPSSRSDAEYGTPEMAESIKELFSKTDVLNKKIIVMRGHKEGIIAFGKELDEAGNALLNLVQNDIF